ncbi:MAG: transposase [Candidatus Kaiserbacteria bacterium]|nr:transposase [Candidatus Kaiserbacteria bacterium]
MRVEPHGVGSVLHVIKRGTRGMDIVRDEYDRQRFNISLFYLNDSFSDPNWIENLKFCKPFERPEHWPEREPLVHILAWTLLPNHFHLLLEETRENGTAKFMQRLCGSMSAAFNAKYSETGSIFQGSYKSKTVDDDSYLRYLAFYIQVKNVFDMYPGGLGKTVNDFEKAWKWALRYSHSSISTYALGIDSPIIEKEFLLELYPDRKTFKKEAREMLMLHLQHHDDKYSHLLLESYD